MHKRKLNNIKSSKGITLIVLVITIIVLLILAGVVISNMTQDESVMDKAKEANVQNNNETEREALKLAYQETIIHVLAENKNMNTEIEKKLNELDFPTIDIAQDYDHKNLYTIVFERTRNMWELNVENGEITYKGIFDGTTCLHRWVFVENIAEPTCTEDGTDKYVCERCEEEKLVTIAKLGHKESSEWQYSAQGHYHSCERCGIQSSELQSHTSAGSCTICGYTGVFSVSNNLFKMTGSNSQTTINYGETYSTTITPVNSLAYKRPDRITVTMGGREITSGYTYNSVSGAISVSNVSGNLVITASAVNYDENISFTNAKVVSLNSSNTAELMQSYQLRVMAYTPTTSGSYKFWSNDSVATTNKTDPYAYIFSSQQGYTIEQLDEIALRYAQTGSQEELNTKALYKDDDSGSGYNFSITFSAQAGVTYYLLVRTYTPSKIQSFNNIYIQKV